MNDKEIMDIFVNKTYRLSPNIGKTQNSLICCNNLNQPVPASQNVMVIMKNDQRKSSTFSLVVSEGNISTWNIDDIQTGRQWMLNDNKLPNNICQINPKVMHLPLKLQHYNVHYYNYQTLYFYNRCHTNHSHNLDLSSIYSIHSFHQHYVDSDICKLFRLKKKVMTMKWNLRYM